MSKKSKVVTSIIFISMMGVLVFCGFKIYQIYREYKDGSDAYEEIKEHVDIPERITEESETDDSDDIDFLRLQEIYPGIVGWIQIPAFEISYPIMQGNDNQYYLNHLPTGETAKCGSIFLDYHNHPDFSDKNSILYGHHMKDGTMFAALKRYHEFPDDTYFYVYTPETVLRYQVISAYQGGTGEQAYTYDLPDQKDVLEFIQFMDKRSEIKADAVCSVDDRFITLSTCDNRSNAGRFIIHGKLIMQEAPTRCKRKPEF